MSVTPTSPAQYHFRDQVLEADRCVPLVDAIDEGAVNFGGLGRGGYPGEAFSCEDDLPGLRSIGYWDASKPCQWCLDEHRNEGIEIAFLESGSIPFLLNGQWHDLHSGDLTVTRPWQPHGLGKGSIPPSMLTWIIIDVGVRMPNQEWKWPDWIVLSKNDLDHLTRLLRQNETAFRHSDRWISDAFQRLRKVMDNRDKRQQISKLAVLINSILVSMIELLEAQSEPLDSSLQSSRRAVEIFLKELADHPDFMQREWTLEEMADECHIGRTVFTDLCKEICNQTPFEYLNHCRVNWAANLLIRRPETSVTDIGIEAGFCSSAYFAKVFKKHLAMTPTKYRKQNVPNLQSKL